MRWGILFGALVVVAGCAGKSSSDDDDSGGQASDAGQGGGAAIGQGGSTAARGGSSARAGTSSIGTTGGAVGNPVGGTGGGGTTGGAAGAPTTGGTAGSIDPVCTDLPATFPSTQIAYAGGGTPPSPAGGTIESGLYYLALETFYGEAPECEAAAATYETLGIDLMEVVRFTAQSATAGSMEVMAQITSSTGATPTRVTGAGTYSTSGTDLFIVGTCGEGTGSNSTVAYSATAADLVLFSTTDETCNPTLAIFQKL